MRTNTLEVRFQQFASITCSYFVGGFRPVINSSVSSVISSKYIIVLFEDNGKEIRNMLNKLKTLNLNTYLEVDGPNRYCHTFGDIKS